MDMMRRLASLAKLALANLYQQLNRSSEAVVLYNQLIAKPTSTVPADAARLQLAALYEKTNPAEANKIYAQLKAQRPPPAKSPRKNSSKNSGLSGSVGKHSRDESAKPQIPRLRSG